MQKIRKILITNRGEIAVRIIKTCRKLAITSGAVFSDDDAKALHVRLGDEKFSLGKGTLSDTYLNVDKLIGIAKANHFDAIHPGYGFLSENPAFPKACKENGIIFIGPDAKVIELMGDKIASKKLAENSGAPVLKPFTGDIDALVKMKDLFDYPVLVKAAAGGGGKGMKIVNDPAKLKDTLISTSREAKTYFGDERIFVEKYIRNPRHIEVQVLADQYGNAVALFERECTLQRRHQKVIEEAPSPTLNPAKRNEILDAALRIVAEASYTNAGTVEFLVEENLHFYFLEMNTRIQVEHPVTEAITGIDMVEEQIHIARGGKLRFYQEDLKINGHAIECRIYAEDPENNFYPCPGKIHFYREPSAPGIRIDSSIEGPAEISGNYDPMIAKVISRGKNRSEAIAKMEQALNNYHIHGIVTNLQFQKRLIADKSFHTNELNTHFIDQHLERLLASEKQQANDSVLIAFTLFYDKLSSASENVWNEIGYWRIHQQVVFKVNDAETSYKVNLISNRELKLSDENEEVTFLLIRQKENSVVLQRGHQIYNAVISRDHVNRFQIDYNGQIYRIDREDNLLTRSFNSHNLSVGKQHDNILNSPMPGKILEVNVREGEKVTKDQKLMVLEAMKMENLISAPFESTVEKIFVNENDKVEAGFNLIELKSNSS